jgi:hypothetical protein
MPQPELEKLQRDIDALREATRLDWEVLATKQVPPAKRLHMRKAILARDIELYALLEKMWAHTEIERRSSTPLTTAGDRPTLGEWPS